MKTATVLVRFGFRDRLRVAIFCFYDKAGRSSLPRAVERLVSGFVLRRLKPLIDEQSAPRFENSAAKIFKLVTPLARGRERDARAGPTSSGTASSTRRRPTRSSRDPAVPCVSDRTTFATTLLAAERESFLKMAIFFPRKKNPRRRCSATYGESTTPGAVTGSDQRLFILELRIPKVPSSVAQKKYTSQKTRSKSPKKALKRPSLQAAIIRGCPPPPGSPCSNSTVPATLAPAFSETIRTKGTGFSL